MHEFLLGVLSALWLGLLTSISPCPLATNIAAVSFIGRRIGRTRVVLLTGLLYTLGRVLTYVILGILLVTSVLSIPQVSHILQKYMNKILGLILIFVGMILLELIRFNVTGFGLSEKMQKRVELWGIWGAGLLGVVFALSFCPISAALFFGSLLPLSVKYESGFALPALYGLGTGLPVFLFGVRRITGGIFILIGIYYCLVYIFGVF